VPNGIDITPITLRLRMHRGISVTLRRRRHQEFRTRSQRRFERFKRSIGPGAQRLNPVRGIIHRTRRAGEVKNIIECAPLARLANIFLHKVEPGIVTQMLKVRQSPCQQIVGRHYAIAFA